MARKILIILLLISLLIIPTIIADNSQIKIKTKPYHRLLVTVFKAGITPPERITSINFAPYKNTSASGELTLSLSTSEKKVDLKLDLKKEDTEVVTHDFHDVATTGEPIFINLFPPDNMTFLVGNPIVNITVENTTAKNVTNVTFENVSVPVEPNVTTEESKPKSNFTITGYVTQLYQKNSKTLFYILIVIGVLVGIAIIIFIIRKLPKKTHYPGPAPLYNKRREEGGDRSLAEAEKKLKIAQEEIEKIKSRNQALRDAERKLEEDRQRLEKLRKGY